MVAKGLLNILTGRSSIRSKIRRKRLTRENYKTLRQLEKKGKPYHQLPIYEQLLKLAEVKENDPDYKELLNKRTRVGKFFDYFYTQPRHSEKTIPQILNKDLGTLKRFTQKIKDTLRKKPYLKPLKTRKNIEKRYQQLQTLRTGHYVKPALPSTLKTTQLTQLNPATQKAYQTLQTTTIPTLLTIISGQNVNLTYSNNSCFMNTSLQLLYHIPKFRNGILNIDLTNNLIQQYFFTGARLQEKEKVNIITGDLAYPAKLNGEPIVTLKNIFTAIQNAEKKKDKKINTLHFFNDNFECIIPQRTPNGRRNQQDVAGFIQQCIFERLNTPPTKHLIKMFYFSFSRQLVGYYDNPLIGEGKIEHKTFKKTKKNEADSEFELYDRGRKDNYIKKGPNPVKDINSMLLVSLNNYNDNDVVNLQTLINTVESETKREIKQDFPESLQIPEYFPEAHNTPRIKPHHAEEIITLTIPDTLEYLLINIGRKFGNVKQGHYEVEKRLTEVNLNKNIHVNNKDFALEGIIEHWGDATGGHYGYCWRDTKGDWFSFDDMDPESNALTLTNPTSPFVEFNEKQKTFFRNDKVSSTAVVLLYKKI